MNIINNTYKRIITRVLSGEASASEKERLDAWLSSSEDNRQLYAQYKKIWELEPEKQTDAEFNTQHAWQNVLNMIESGKSGETDETVKQPHRQYGRRFFINKTEKLYWLSGVAAAFLILITTSLFFFLRSPQAEMLALVADQGDAIFTLDDGSQVHLRAGASLHYPQAFTDKKRDVKLDGSAYFEVEKDERRPFVIKTEHATIKVLGTSFFVENKYDHLTVFVSEGSVRLKSIRENSTEAIISKGKSGTLFYEKQQILITSFENMNFLAWKTGRLEFVNEKLDDVFHALQVTYGISIKAPEEVLNLRLTGRFQDETPEDVLQSISLVFGFDMIRKNGEYTIWFENQNLK